MKRLLFVSIFVSSYFISFGQAAQPCLNGNENSCKCSTAPVLCTFDALNGFEYDMTTFFHPGDGPQPMCPPPAGNGTTSQNPSWFGFIANCANMNVRVHYTNCIDGPYCGGNNDFGIQAAVYSNCSLNPNSVVAGGCGTSVSGCVNNSFRTLNMTNLIIGKIYYFLVDGCCGSACHIRIEVLSPPCPPTMGAWPSPMTGPSILCVNQVGTFSYQTIIGGTQYLWTVNGTISPPGDKIEDVPIASFTRDFSFATPGTYILCVDGLNDCVPFSADPPPLCKTVTVVGPVAGTITASPTPVCPGGTVNLTTTGYDPAHTKYILVVNSAGNIVKIINGTSGTHTYTPCGTFTAYAYNYYPGTGTVPVLNANISTIMCTTTCCKLDSAPFTYGDTVGPTFVSPPANASYTCFNDVPAIANLNYTDNCDPPDNVAGTQVNSYTNCAGGTISRTWTKTDLCGNTSTYVQTITILPIPVATVVGGPANMTIPCAQIPLPGVLPPLNYTNNSTGSCLISGTIIPTRVDNISNCAGTITYTWTATDICGRTIQHIQVLTVQPPAVAVLQNPPSNQNVACVDIPLPGVLPPLNYDNLESGSCRIFGTIIPTRVDNITNCAGTITYTWSTTDPCNRLITHSQVLTILPPPLAAFNSLPPNMTINCPDIPAAGVLPPLNYTNSSSGACLIMGTVIPTRVNNIVNCVGTITYTWQFTDYCNRNVSHIQVLTVLAPPLAAFNNPPANMTVDCPSIPAAGVLPPLTYTNNSSGSCLISGSVIPTRVDNIVNCVGTITYTWQFTDYCNRNASHIQVLTVQHPNLASFISPPVNMTVDCPSIPAPGVLPTLNYTNGSTGSCLIEGMVTPTRVDNIVNCIGTITYTWQFTDYCNRNVSHTQVLTVQPPTLAAFVNPPSNMNVDCPSIPAPGVLPTLNYTNNSSGACLIQGMVTPTRVDNITNCLGTITYTWQFVDYCNRTVNHTQVLTVQPPPVAVLSSMPASMTINCPDIPAAGVLPQLTYTNSSTGACLIQGTLTPTRVDNIVNCAGTITYTWQTTDYCNRSIMHTQVLTVLPPPVAVLSSMPASMTINCPDVPAAGVLPQLTYTNGSTGSCLIQGTLTPTRVDNISNCTGTITFTWQTTDYCNRPIMHIQVLTVLAPPVAVLSSIPANMTINCPDIPAAGELPQLTYTNGSTGSCLIQGTLTPTRVDNIVNCAGTITFTWQTTDYCNRPITHTQILTVLPPPVAVLSSMPASATVDCPNIPAPGILPTLTYTNNSTGSCLIQGTITPTRVDNIVNCAGTITFTWQATDYCNRQIQHIQILTVLPPPEGQFTNPPASQNIDCSQVPSAGTLPPLAYTNGSTGSCLISGSAVPTRVDNITNCAGTITFTWMFTDYCNRTKQHQQILTVVPPAEAFPINPPASGTVNCDQIPPAGTVPSLMYSNSLTGNCLVDGSMTGTRIDNIVNCMGTVTFNWTATDRCGRAISHSQVLTVLPPPPVVLTNAPTYTTPLTCAQAITFTAPSINYSNSATCLIQGTLLPVVTNNYTQCGGTININWAGTDACNRPVNYNQIIIVQAAAPPTFTSALPQDITISCGDVAAYNIPLNYSNGLTGSCQLSGSILGILNAPNPLCGGVATITWNGLDACNNALSHIQNITISPAPQAIFSNTPPTNITVTCDMVPTQIPSLSYANNATGQCSISGSVAGSESGSYGPCGGNLQYTWQFTDACGRTIVFNQNVTVLPSAAPVNFVNVPADLNLGCGQTYDPPIDLFFTNGLSGSCSISGIATPIIQDFTTYRIYTWNFVHPCTNNSVTVTQTVNIVPFPDIIIDPEYVSICEGHTFDLSTVNVTDLNNQTNTISYHSNSPATDFNKLSSPIVSPNTNQLFFVIKATNVYGCYDEAFVQFIITTQTGAGDGLNGTECNDVSPVNLWNYISGNYDPFGFWTEPANTGIDLSDPSSVSFSGVTPGIYNFEYHVSGTNGCPDDVSTVSITIVSPGTFNVSSVSCAGNFQTYSVQINVVGYVMTSNFGTIVSNGNNNYTINNIPIANTVQLTFTSNIGNCGIAQISVSPPNCNCPNVPAPVSTGDKIACIDATGTILSVTVGVGLNVNWYANAQGGTAIISNSLSYSPPTNILGTFTFFAESIDPQNGCVSNLRTPVKIQVVSKPIATNASLRVCDDNGDGFAEFNLNNAKTLVTPNPANTVSFHLTLAQAQTGTSPLGNLFTNTNANQIVYASIKNTNNCVSTAELILVVVQPPTANLNIKHETCLNSKNGSIEVNAAGLNTFRLNSLPYGSINIFNDLSPGVYTVSVRNADLCVSTYNVTINPGQVLNLDEYTIVCNNNGTPSLSTDDFYTVTFKVSNTTNVTNMFEVFYKGVSFGKFTYGTTHTITLPANGSNGLIEFIDEILGCKTSKVVNNLTPCSTSCQITFTGLTSTCNDNGTSSIGTDDFYVISLTATALNGSSSNSYNVIVDNVTIGTYTYGSLISFNLPATGTVPQIILRDKDDLQCIANIVVPALNSCSGACQISSVVSNIRCNDNGTINDPSDDTYSFDIRVTGLNVSTGWRVQGDPTVRNYATVHKLGPFPISGGNLSSMIFDNVTTTCLSNLNVTAPNVCSEPCILDVSELSVGPCNDAGTGNNNADDFFSVSFKVTVTSGSANFYYVKEGTKTFGPFNYGQTVVINNLPATGSNILLSISDGINLGCIQTINVSKPPCSQCNHTVDAGLDITLSCLQNTATLVGTSSSAGVFTWTGPMGFIKVGMSVQTTTPGTYVLSVIFPDQCVVKDSVKVLKDNGLPVSNAGPDKEITCKVGSVVLTGSSNLASNQKYIWTNALGAEIGSGLSITVTTPGLYYFEVINLTNNCSSGKDEVEVKDNTKKPIALIMADPGNLLDCIIGTVKLTGQPSDNVIFNWLVNETIILNKNSIIVDKEGIVTMTAIDTINGCQKTAQIQIIDLQDYPILILDPVVPITCVNNSTIISAQKSPQGPNLVFQWYNANNELINAQNKDTLRVFSPGTYFVVLTDTLNGCSNKDTVMVGKIGDFPEIKLPADQKLLCGKTASSIAVTVTNPVEPVNILWTTTTGSITSSISNPSITTNGAGVYTVQVTYPTSGCKSTESVQIQVLDDVPKAIIGIANDETCKNERDGSFILSSIRGGLSPYTYKLNGVSTTKFINLSAGKYTLQVIDANGCTKDSVFNILPGGDFSITPISPLLLIFNQSDEVEVITNLSASEIQSVKWTPKTNLSCDTCLITTIIGKQDITYEVVITDIYGCEEKISVLVKIKDNVIISIPNIINSTGGTNKYFTIYGNETLINIEKMSIFDRWGNLMFTKSNFKPNIPEEGWDGKFNNQDVVPGVYVYTIEYLSNTGMKVISGDISVIK